VATTDSYGQGVSISSLTDKPDAETLAKNIANGIASRSVLRFASAAARTAALAGEGAPVEGMLSYLADTNLIYTYTGSTWRLVAPLLQYGSVNVSFTNKDQHLGNLVTFPIPYSTNPIVGVEIHSTAGAASRWTSKPGDVTLTTFRPFLQSGQDGALATWDNIQLFWWAIGT
jgi:hypothetical protein